MILSKLTDLERCEIRDYYVSGEYNTSELTKMYKTTQRSICLYLKQEGIQIKSNSTAHQKYTLDEFYFDEMNTEDKAYFLGILFADGTNSIKLGIIRLRLQENDIDILEKLRKVIKYTGPLVFESQFRTRLLKNSNTQDGYCLSLRSRILSAQLDDLGMWPCKSDIVEYPDCITKGLHRHFIRGYMDGGGSISPQQICFCSTVEFCTSISIILKNMNIKTRITKDIRSPNNSNLYIRFKDDRKAFLDWIYEGSTIYMDRKYQSYLEYYC